MSDTCERAKFAVRSRTYGSCGPDGERGRKKVVAKRAWFQAFSIVKPQLWNGMKEVEEEEGVCGGGIRSSS